MSENQNPDDFVEGNQTGSNPADVSVSIKETFTPTEAEQLLRDNVTGAINESGACATEIVSFTSTKSGHLNVKLMPSARVAEQVAALRRGIAVSRGIDGAIASVVCSTSGKITANLSPKSVNKGDGGDDIPGLD